MPIPRDGKLEGWKHVTGVQKTGSRETPDACPFCGTSGEPIGRLGGVVEAAEMVPAHTFGGKDWLEDLHVFFHETCYPHGSENYKLVSAN